MKAWNPLKEMVELENRLSTIFNRTGTVPGDNKEETLRVTEWAPLVDIAEDDKGYTIKAELPGIKKEDIAVTVENGVLSIKGERKSEQEEKSKRYHRIERFYGRFERSFTLPEDADGTKVGAEYKDGVLKVHLAKSEKALPKAIEVKVA